MYFLRKNLFIRILLFGIALSCSIFLGLIIYNSYIFYQSNIAIYESNDLKKESNFSSINLSSDGLYDKNTKTLLAGYTKDDKSFLYTIGRISTYSSSSIPKLNNLWRNIDISRIDAKNHLDVFDQYTLSDLALNIKPSKKGRTYVFDLLVNKNKLYISYVNYYRSNLLCDRFSIIALDIDSNSGKLSNPQDFWSAKTCVSLQMNQWHGFSGRMAADNKSVYMIAGLIVSELYTNIYPENNNSSLMNELEDQLEKDQLFSRVIKINKQTNQSETFAKGFRSPGGLFFDSSSTNPRIWGTDHGPRGGDELNLILEGFDYGWPYVSMGEPYILHEGGNAYEIQTNYKNHDGYQAPSYYWTPSIGTSQVSVLQSDLSFHDDWIKGDVIVSSLKEKSLFHLKMDSKMSVKSVEKIAIGHRIRSLLQLDNALYMSTDDGQVIRLSFALERLNQGPYPPIGNQSNLYKYQLDPIKYMFSKIIKGLNRRIRSFLINLNQEYS